MLVPTILIFALGPDSFSDTAKNIENYIKETSSIVERFIPNLRHIDESAQYYFLQKLFFSFSIEFFHFFGETNR